MDALDLAVIDPLAQRAESGIIPSDWDESAALLFATIHSSADYSRLLASMTTGRIGAAETFALRWAQHAVRSDAPALLREAVLAASVRQPVSKGWDDATFAVASIVRACEVANWDLREITQRVESIIGHERAARLLRYASFETPILDVAGMYERFGPAGWELH